MTNKIRFQRLNYVNSYKREEERMEMPYILSTSETRKMIVRDLFVILRPILFATCKMPYIRPEYFLLLRVA